MAASQGLSLKGRALRHLAAREHSRLELTRKLAPHAESAEQVQQLLDELEAAGWLSAERFAESVAHRRAARFGTARIQAELKQHRIPDDVAGELLAALRSNECQRAQEIWARRFGALPTTPQERQKQSRFLAQRGFSADVIQRVIKGADDPFHEG